jgi:hypothetical protein
MRIAMLFMRRQLWSPVLILWGSLMLYFLIYYETLPRDHDGTSPGLVTLTPPFLLHLLYPRNPTALLPRLCNCGS